MLQEIDYKFYSALLNGDIAESKVSKKVLNSKEFFNLIEAGIISKTGAGRGIKYQALNKDRLINFIHQYFPDHLKESDLNDKNEVAGFFRDSKAKAVKSNPIFFVRGFHDTEINGLKIDLKRYIETFGVFAVQSPAIKYKKVCIVENLDSFMIAEKLLGQEYIYLHKYGRIGISSLSGIVADEILVFPDYDFIGLNEYLGITDAIASAKLYIPSNFDLLFKKYSKILPEKQIPSEKLMKCTDLTIAKIRDEVLRTNRFLEQQIIFRNCES